MMPESQFIQNKINHTIGNLHIWILNYSNVTTVAFHVLQAVINKNICNPTRIDLVIGIE